VSGLFYDCTEIVIAEVSCVESETVETDAIRWAITCISPLCLILKSFDIKKCS
jgi:hypothetical protein